MTDIIKNNKRSTKEYKVNTTPQYKKMGITPDVFSNFSLEENGFENIDDKNILTDDKYSLLTNNFTDKNPNTYFLFIKNNLVASGNLALIEQCCLDALLQNTSYKDVQDEDIVVLKKIDFSFGLHLKEKIGD